MMPRTALPERSILTNARNHVGRDVVINLDLKDFFPTLTYARVKGSVRSAGLCRSGRDPARAVVHRACCRRGDARSPAFTFQADRARAGLGEMDFRTAFCAALIAAPGFDGLRQFEPILSDQQPRLNVNRAGSRSSLLQRFLSLLPKSDGIMRGHAMSVFASGLYGGHCGACRPGDESQASM